LPLRLGRSILPVMFEDDLDPRKPKKILKPLDNYSIEELKEYITNLEAEIVRAGEWIAKKEAHKNAAANFFKTTKQE